MASMTATTHGQTILPAKELSLFKKCVKHYEQKQHKTALRCIKQIMANPACAEHGETLSMKALIFDVTGRHSEAVEMAKKALSHDLKSHVCWHIFGMVMRSDRKFTEALKALKRALTISSNNPQILRDLALVQVHIRDYVGFQETRYIILKGKSSNRQAWMGYIVASYLAKDFFGVMEGIKEYRQPLMNDAVKNGPELFEVLLFELRALEEMNRLEDALALAQHPSNKWLDKSLQREVMGRLLMKLNRLDEAAKEFEALIIRNSEKVDHYKNLEFCRGLEDPDKISERLAIYDDVLKRHPKALYPKVAPLFFTSNEEFYSRLLKYVIDGLRAGLPSLFQTLRPLYADKEKVTVIHNMVDLFLKKLEEEYNDVCLDGSEFAENPTTIMWTYYFAAYHFDALHQGARACEIIKVALSETPTVVELYLCHARILKHMGCYEEAMKVMIQAHMLDTADRYVNCKLVKYMMRCGDYQRAIAYAGKFTKEHTDPLTSLVEMQSLWIEIELAYSLYMNEKYGPALKICHEIDNQYIGFFDDQYDFHSYCMRKATVCGYSDLINMTDTIRNQRPYLRAVNLAMKIYMELADKRIEDEKKNLEPKEVKKETAEERKQRRKANKLAKVADGKKEDAKDAKDLTKFTIDDDAGEQYVNAANHLENAVALAEPLLALDVQNMEYYLNAFALFKRLPERFMDLTKVVAKAALRFPGNPEFHRIFDEYVRYLAENPKDGVVKETVDILVKKVTSNPAFTTHQKKNVSH